MLTSLILLTLANSTKNLADPMAVAGMLIQVAGLPSLPGVAVWEGSKVGGLLRAKLSERYESVLNINP